MRGLGAACYVAGSWKPQADAERLDETRHACELGYATACWGLDLNDETVRWWTHEIRDALVVRAGLPGCARGSAWGCVHAGKPDEARVAAIDGCMHGYLEECEIEIHDLHMQRAQYEQVCRLTGRKCLRLADELRELDATAARDALEHGCQFGERMACAELVRGYRDRTFPEPVPDRGAQLAAFLCKSDDRKSSCERKRD